MENFRAMLRDLAAVQLALAAVSDRASGMPDMREELANVNSKLIALGLQIANDEPPYHGPDAMQVQIDALSQRVARVDHRLLSMDEQVVRSVSARHAQPKISWTHPVVLAQEIHRYSVAFPRKPARPCFYHKSRTCESLQGVFPEDLRGPPAHAGARDWFVHRNHIWKPCPFCVWPDDLLARDSDEDRAPDDADAVRLVVVEEAEDEGEAQDPARTPSPSVISGVRSMSSGSDDPVAPGGM